MDIPTFHCETPIIAPLIMLPFSFFWLWRNECSKCVHKRANGVVSKIPRFSNQRHPAPSTPSVRTCGQKIPPHFWRVGGYRTWVPRVFSALFAGYPGTRLTADYCTRVHGTLFNLLWSINLQRTEGNPRTRPTAGYCTPSII